MNGNYPRPLVKLIEILLVGGIVLAILFFSGVLV